MSESKKSKSTTFQKPRILDLIERILLLAYTITFAFIGYRALWRGDWQKAFAFLALVAFAQISDDVRRIRKGEK